MRLRLGISEQIPLSDMKDALDAALEASTASQVPLIETGRVPTFVQGLRRNRIRWQPEPPGDEHFDSASIVLRRGHGDCDDLAPWHAASLRATGQDERARAVAKRSGPHRWHAVVKRGDGSIEDPSAAAGMHEFKRRHGVSGPTMVVGVDAPLWPSMFGPRAGVAVTPEYGWLARTDLPDMGLPWSWSSMARGRSPASAARASIVGVLGFSDRADADVSEADYVRLAGLADLLSGASIEECAEALEGIYGDDSVGFLPLLASALPAASGLLSSVTKMIPGAGGGGGGGGGAPAAAPPAAPAPAPSGGGGGGYGPVMPGTTMSIPGGTTIVRF